MSEDIGRLGERVIYRSRTGDYSLAGVITATRGSINLLGVERGHVPPITEAHRVHLIVFTPGLPPVDTPPVTRTIVDTARPLGERVRQFSYEGGLPELSPTEFVACQAWGGSYQEFDIPLWCDPERMQLGNRVVFGQDGFTYADQAPGTWMWA